MSPVISAFSRQVWNESFTETALHAGGTKHNIAKIRVGKSTEQVPVFSLTSLLPVAFSSQQIHRRKGDIAESGSLFIRTSGRVECIRLSSFSNQWYVDVWQVYHVPMEPLLELWSMVRTLKCCYGFSLMGKHLKILNWSYRHQQISQLVISGWRRKPFNWHDTRLRLALHYAEVLFVWHQASSAHLSTYTSASTSHNDLIW